MFKPNRPIQSICNVRELWQRRKSVSPPPRPPTVWRFLKMNIWGICWPDIYMQNSFWWIVLEKNRLDRQKGTQKLNLNCSFFLIFSELFICIRCLKAYMKCLSSMIKKLAWLVQFWGKKIRKNCKKGAICLDLFDGQVSFSLGPALRPVRVMMLKCLRVCLCVCVSVPVPYIFLW